MSRTNITEIDFHNLGGPVYSGRDRGELTRNKLMLDQLDTSEDPVKVIVPGDTYSVTSSYFLGLFGKSIRTLGSREDFFTKYEFQAPERFKPKFDSYAERALREKKLLI